jgi:RiboL-PSP-HEPN
MTTRSHGLLDQVDELIKHARNIPFLMQNNEGDFIQAQLVRYGCLLACAALEQGLIESLAGYALRIGDDRVKTFVEEILRTGRNLTPSYINEIFCKFDSSWGSRITSYMEDVIGTEKIQSIVSNRNRIAHGESVSLGVKSLMEWTPEVRKLCLELNEITTTANFLRSGNSRRRRRRRRG